LKIRSVDAFKVSIPMKPENLSFGKVDRVDYNIVRVEAGEFIGFGEAATLGGPRWSEESIETIDVIVRNYLSKIIVDRDTSEYQKISLLMDENVQGNNFAKAAVEMAVLDAYGKELEKPVSSIIGGRYRDSVLLSWTIANNDPELDAEEAGQVVKNGWTILKIKVGSLSIQEDVDRVRAVRDSVGEAISLRIDVNQGWTLDQAFSALPALSEEGVDFIEQPLQKWDVSGASIFANGSPIPVVADEALTNMNDAFELIKERAAAVFAYKLTKVGGFTHSREIYSLARAHRIKSYVGCMIETSIGTAAYLQFASSLTELTYGCELFGPLRLKDDLVTDKITYGRGTVNVPEGAGLGVKVDEDKLEKLAAK
jgi:muconate/chloromuconate cycloisomerase